MSEAATDYPRETKLPDGGSVQVRMMSADDRDAVLAFAQSLPEEDLLFLRVDLTEPSVIDEWISNLESGSSTSLVAYDADAGPAGSARSGSTSVPAIGRAASAAG